MTAHPGSEILRCSAAVACALTLAVASAAAYAAPPEISWGSRIEIATGEGHRGPWRMNESEYRYVDDPTVAITAAGIVGVAWADQAQKDLFFQAFGPDGKPRFLEPANVSRTPRVFSWLPRIAMSPGGSEVHVLWQEIVFAGGTHGGEIFYARSLDGGRTFSNPLNLSHTTGGAGKGRLTRELWHNGSLELVMGPEGQLYAAWTEYEGSLRFSRSTDRGESFSEPVSVAGARAALPARGPSLAVDAEGDIYLAWSVGEDPGADIQLAKSTDQGRSFRMLPPVHRSDGHADAPKIAVDGQGVLHLVYADRPEGTSGRYHIIHARSPDGGATFTNPQRISGWRPGQYESESFPSLGLDGDGNLYVIWELFTRRSQFPRGLAYTASGDGGRTFAAPALVPGSVDPDRGVNGSQQGFLMRKLAVSPSGTIAIVNSTFWWDRRSEVWLLLGH